MKFKDYYQVMGVSENAGDDEIKKAYRKLAREFHPDRNKASNAEEKFKEIGEAYDVLKDKEKRANYDMMRKRGYHHGDDFSPPPGFGGSAHAGGQADFGDLFSSLFGEGGFGSAQSRRGGPSPFEQQGSLKGENVELSVSIDLEDAFAGAKRTIRVPHQGGTKTLKITIPTGTLDGQKIRLKGLGEQGRQAAGDLIISLNIKPHPLFRIDGATINLTLPISPWEAALGAKVSVPTLAGKVMLSIPANSQSGDKLRLPKRGMPVTPPGNQNVELKIVNPLVSTDEQRALFAQLKENYDFDPRKDLNRL